MHGFYWFKVQVSEFLSCFKLLKGPLNAISCYLEVLAPEIIGGIDLVKFKTHAIARIWAQVVIDTTQKYFSDNAAMRKSPDMPPGGSA